MRRTGQIFLVVAVGAGLAVAVAILISLGGRRSARAQAGADARLAAAVTPAAASGTWLGMTLQPVTDVMRRQLKLPRAGAVVGNVAAGGPAARAGLQVGDLIRRVGETTVRRPADVIAALQEVDPGTQVKLAVWRQGATLELQLAPAAPPVATPRPPALLPEATVEMEVAWLGLDIVPLNPIEAREANLGPGTRGMLVDDVADGRGVEAGITTGDVIVAVNGKATRSIAEFKAATRDAAGALVDLLRRGRHLYVTVPPPGTTAAERRLMQKRLPLTKVNWDGPWPMAPWPPPYARGVGWTWPPSGAAAPPAFAGGAAPGQAYPPRFEDWRGGVREDWRVGALEEQRRALEEQQRALDVRRRVLDAWRQRLGAAPGTAPPGIGAFSVGR